MSSASKNTDNYRLLFNLYLASFLNYSYLLHYITNQLSFPAKRLNLCIYFIILYTSTNNKTNIQFSLNINYFKYQTLNLMIFTI